MAIPGVTGGILDTTNFAAIQAGVYYFTATKMDPSDAAGYGCTSSPIKATIRDLSIDPILVLSTTANQNCDLSFANGTLGAIATTGGVPGSSYSYSLSSPVLGAPVDSLYNDSQVNYSYLQPGIYTVLVVDDNSLCSYSRTATINDNPVYIDINDVVYTVNDQTICAPDGSVIINSISDQGIPRPLNEYAYSWFEGLINLSSGNALAAVDSYLDTTNHITIGKGIYYFSITKATGTYAPGEGCESAPFRADIFDVSTDPNLSFVQEAYNSSCDILNPNGEISAIAIENDGTDTDPYSFVWTYNGSILNPGTIQIDSDNTSLLTDAPDGNYQLMAVNRRTRCQVTGGSQLKIDLHISEPNIIVVDVLDPLNCNPTGQLKVTEIHVGGIPANVNDFDYEWYKGNFTPGDLILDSLGNQVVSPQLQEQYPDRYYVIARNIGTACESDPKQADISNANIIYPDLYIDAIAPQTSCDPMMPNAALVATVDGGNDDTNPNYRFEWFNSLNGTGSVFATTSSIFGLGADNYSVTVLDLITNCASTDYYITEDAIELYKPVISVAASPRDNCAADNGSASAQVINVFGNFEFNWYTGSQPGTIPDYTGSSISGLPIGKYTVVATELDSTFCLSDPVVLEIRDQRIKPVITVSEDNPLTNCWENSPNGQLTATVGGVTGGYLFEWFHGSDTTGLADFIGSTYVGLTPQTYTVVVTDLRTQCDEIASRTLNNNTVTPPMPDPEVVQHYMSCIEPDGWVRVSVDGNVTNYFFNWHDGNSASGSPDHSGINYGELVNGEYTVTAMDMVTGCISPGVTVEVLDLRDLPAFTYNIVPAKCERMDGSIELVWENNVPIAEIIWIDPISGGQIDMGSAIYNYLPGFYGVIVTSIYGCVTEDEVEIPTEIFEFNGISANGDGRNDYFEIACITNFPNNNVKIFNRAGQLVYETYHYDNADNAFKGIGENGMYLMGRELPDGTYFYIIDKGDGSEPIPGYLELIR
jgi:gliding motility-associated-like protein